MKDMGMAEFTQRKRKRLWFPSSQTFILSSDTMCPWESIVVSPGINFLGSKIEVFCLLPWLMRLSCQHVMVLAEGPLSLFFLHCSLDDQELLGIMVWVE